MFTSLSLPLPTSPPVSPSALVSPIPSHDDKTHIKSILETVCQTKDVGKEAISKLCSHVKADAQEEKVKMFISTCLFT